MQLLNKLSPMWILLTQCMWIIAFSFSGHLVNERKYINILQMQSIDPYPKSIAETFKSYAILSMKAAASILYSTASLKVLADNNQADDLSQEYSLLDVTDKAYIDIKISNYSEESIGKNQPATGSGKLVIGLFGKKCPKAVNLFLKTCRSNGDDEPTYLNSQFSRINYENGLLEIEKVRGLEVLNIAGVDQYDYRGKLLPGLEPIVESNVFRHTKRGLLSRRQLSGGPEFGITTRSSPELDQFHEVFGIVLEGIEVLDAIEAIPRYTYTTKTGYLGNEKGSEGIFSDFIFENQKKFYVSLGKALGDKRAIDQRGKILRRIIIKGCEVIK